MNNKIGNDCHCKQNQQKAILFKKLKKGKVFSPVAFIVIPDTMNKQPISHDNHKQRFLCMPHGKHQDQHPGKRQISQSAL